MLDSFSSVTCSDTGVCMLHVERSEAREKNDTNKISHDKSHMTLINIDFQNNIIIQLYNSI